MDNELILEDVVGDKIFKVWVRRTEGRVYRAYIDVARSLNSNNDHGGFSVAMELLIPRTGKYKMKCRGSWNYTPEQLKFLLTTIQDTADKV